MTREGERGWCFGHPLAITSGQVIGMQPAGWIPAAFISGPASTGVAGSGGETASPVGGKGDRGHLSEAAQGAGGAESWDGPCRHCPHCAAMLIGSDVGNKAEVVVDTTVEERTNRALDAVRSFDHRHPHCATRTGVYLSRSSCLFVAHINVRYARA